MPPSTIEEDAQKKPQPDLDNKPENNKPLSETLNENEGVLKPPPEVDPNMSKPVIIPPGEPGGGLTVQPK